jgi:hypothetical protein
MIFISALSTTRKIARGSFLPASILMIYFGIETVDKYNYTPEDLRDEYLSQGTVDIYARSTTTTLVALIRDGLYDLIPELNIESKKTFLWSRVKELREELFA